MFAACKKRKSRNVFVSLDRAECSKPQIRGKSAVCQTEQRRDKADHFVLSVQDCPTVARRCKLPLPHECCMT